MHVSEFIWEYFREENVGICPGFPSIDLFSKDKRNGFGWWGLRDDCKRNKAIYIYFLLELKT
jgi:hypothetical protein